MISLKEKAIWRVFDQMKVFQQMETTLEDIVSRIVDKSSIEFEVQPAGMQAASRSLL